MRPARRRPGHQRPSTSLARRATTVERQALRTSVDGTAGMGRPYRAEPGRYRRVHARGARTRPGRAAGAREPAGEAGAPFPRRTRCRSTRCGPPATRAAAASRSSTTTRRRSSRPPARLKERELVRVVWSDRTAHAEVPPDARRSTSSSPTTSGRWSPCCCCAGPVAGRAAHPDRTAPPVRRPGRRGGLPAAPRRPTRRWSSRLERRPGQQDHRWVHLLGPVDLGPRPRRARARVDRDVVLADGAAARTPGCARRTTSWPPSYAAELGDELDGKPFDAWLLDRVAGLAGADPVVEVGCGPGQVAARLAAAGADVTGVDLSPAMVAEARPVSRTPASRWATSRL